MATKFTTLLLVASLTSIPLITSIKAVKAKNCPFSSVVPPLRQTKIIRQPRFNYHFSIPQNYRTMAVHNEGILVFDPNSFATAQCLLRTKAPTEYPHSISIYAKSVNLGNRSLATLVRQENPGVEELKSTTVGKQKAISYISNTLGQAKNVSFLTPNRKYLITISTPFNYQQGQPTTVFNSAVFNTVLSTFTFVNVSSTGGKKRKKKLRLELEEKIRVSQPCPQLYLGWMSPRFSAMSMIFAPSGSSGGNKYRNCH